MSSLTLRLATSADIPTLERWDLEPLVVSATSDKPQIEKAFGADNDWAENLGMHQDDIWEHWIAEVGERPIGAMQMIDPHLEPTHYWGDVGKNLRALDIWIGDASDRGRGYGAQMMQLGITRAFARPEVRAILIDPLNSNIRPHRFYQRLGFKVMGRQVFNDEDDCLVHRLSRHDWEARGA